MPEYVKKLRIAERNLESTSIAQTEIPQQQQSAPQLQQQQQQMMMVQQQIPQPGGYQGGYYDESRSHNQLQPQHPAESEYEQSQVLAAGVDRKSGMPTKKVAAGNVDDNHFADVDLDDDLLPT